MNSDDSTARIREGSRKGGNVSRNRAITRWKAENKRCPNCNKRIPYEKRRSVFCNHSCSASFNNKGIRRHGEEPKTCLVCGNSIGRHQLYCSRDCFQEDRFQRYIDKWLKGETSGTRKDGSLSQYVRRWLFQRYSNKCSECGWSQTNPYSNTIPLEVDHIDGNWKNNRPENLNLLCPNCHSLTPYHCGLNRGNGRGFVPSRYFTDNKVKRVAKTVTISCAYCGKPKEIKESLYFTRLKKGQTNFYCNRTCLSASQKR